MTNYTIPLRLISFIIFEWNDPWKGIPSRHSGREWMMDGDYPLLYQGDDLFPFLLIFTSFFLSFSTTGLSVWTVPAWGGCRRWKQIPGSSPPHGHATSRLSWRWRDFPGPGHLSLWRSRVRGTCALCRDGWPIIHFLFGKDVLYYYHTIHRSITGLKRWWMKERKKKKGWKPFHRRMWLWYTRRIATWPASHWRRTAVARRRLWNDAGSLCGRGPWRRRFASCTYWPSRPPDGPKGSTDPLRCRPSAPLDCWHWNLSG